VIHFELGIVVILVCTVFSELVEFYIAWIFLNKKITKINGVINPKQSASLFVKSIPFGMSAIFIIIYYKIDITLLSFMTNDTVVGWYGAAYNLIEGLLFIPIAFTTAISPLAAQLFVKSVSKLKKLFIDSLRYMIIIAIPIAVGTTILSKKIITLVYGAQYEGTIIALSILIWSIIPTFIHYVLGLFIISSNNEKKGMVSTGICAVINIILNIILIQ
jgi:O-antigen/teichoic acid export membrane protein